MPRVPRLHSTGNVFHVMLRGNNRQIIFEDEEDALKFLETLHECRNASECEIYAFCLMSNHIHLLIRPGREPLGKFIQRTASRYVYWYNAKHERVGHLFQGRYRSEPIRSDRQFLSVLRYIIQNPMKAGIEAAPGQYPWSSYHSYAGRWDGITTTDFALSMFPDQMTLLSFFAQKNDFDAMDLPAKKNRVTDEQALRLMYSIADISSLADFQRLPHDKQKMNVQMLRKMHLSLRQIARITGLSTTTIYRWLKKT